MKPNTDGSYRGPVRQWRALVLAVLATASLNAPAAASQHSQAAGIERLTATVKAVDLERHTLDLITGVGHALRIRRVSWSPALEITGPTPGPHAAALTPGCIVRVECRTTSAGLVASRMEVLRAAPPRMKP